MIQRSRLKSRTPGQKDRITAASCELQESYALQQSPLSWPPSVRLPLLSSLGFLSRTSTGPLNLHWDEYSPEKGRFRLEYRGRGRWGVVPVKGM